MSAKLRCDYCKQEILPGAFTVMEWCRYPGRVRRLDPEAVFLIHGACSNGIRKEHPPKDKTALWCWKPIDWF